MGVNETTNDDYKKEFEKVDEFIYGKFFSKNNAYGFMRQLDILVSGSPKLKLILYLMLTKTDPKDDTTGTFEIGK